MFAELSLSWQYLYVFLFSLLVGLQAPIGGGLGFGAISLAVSAGAIMLAGNTWADKFLTHPTLCYLAPSLLLVALVALAVALLIVGFALGMSAGPTPSGLGGFGIIFGPAFLILISLPVFVPLRALHVSGGLLVVSLIGVIIGFIIACVCLIEGFEHFYYGFGYNKFGGAVFCFLLFLLLPASSQYFLLKHAGKQIRAAKAVAVEVATPQNAVAEASAVPTERTKK